MPKKNEKNIEKHKPVETKRKTKKNGIYENYFSTKETGKKFSFFLLLKRLALYASDREKRRKVRMKKYELRA